MIISLFILTSMVDYVCPLSSSTRTWREYFPSCLASDDLDYSSRRPDGTLSAAWAYILPAFREAG